MCFTSRDMYCVMLETEADFRLLWNVSNCWPLYMALHLKRIEFSLLPLWDHQNLQPWYYLQRECRVGFGTEDWQGCRSLIQMRRSKLPSNNYYLSLCECWECFVSWVRLHVHCIGRIYFGVNLPPHFQFWLVNKCFRFLGI